MKLSKAIEVLESSTTISIPAGEIEHLDATRLGKEALKWRQLMERDYGDWCGPPLPGETPEGSGGV